MKVFINEEIPLSNPSLFRVILARLRTCKTTPQGGCPVKRLRHDNQLSEHDESETKKS